MKDSLRTLIDQLGPTGTFFGPESVRIEDFTREEAYQWYKKFGVGEGLAQSIGMSMPLHPNIILKDRKLFMLAVTKHWMPEVNALQRVLSCMISVTPESPIIIDHLSNTPLGQFDIEFDNADKNYLIGQLKAFVPSREFIRFFESRSNMGPISFADISRMDINDMIRTLGAENTEHLNAMFCAQYMAKTIMTHNASLEQPLMSEQA